MPTGIIPADSLAGGTRVIGYCRVSELTQVRNGSLERQKQSMLKDIRSSRLNLQELVEGHEYGQLSADRSVLLRAVELGRTHEAGIVAADLSRLLRSEAFDKVTNRLAVPTPEEIEALLALADGVPFVATMAHPDLTPSQLHSLAVRRGMKAKGHPGGRPSSIDHRIGCMILNDHQGGDSLQQIADRYRLTKAAVQRFVQKWHQCSVPEIASEHLARRKQRRVSYRKG
jgi:hypothetical protein